MGKNTTNKMLNPKRLKITVGIILIFLFGLVLDFTCPLSGKTTDIESQIKQAKINVEYLSGLIDEYYELNGEYPPFLGGGDSEGYRIYNFDKCESMISCGTKISYFIDKRDSLISSGIMNSYPVIKRDSIADKRTFVSFIIRTKVKKYLLGKNGNRMANISNVLRDDFAYENYLNSNINPLTGMFLYTSIVPFNKPGYDLFIMGNTFDESFNLHDKTKWFQSPYYDDNADYIPREPNGFIYGISVRHEDEIPKITEYEYGVQ